MPISTAVYTCPRKVTDIFADASPMIDAESEASDVDEQQQSSVSNENIYIVSQLTLHFIGVYVSQNAAPFQEDLSKISNSATRVTNKMSTCAFNLDASVNLFFLFKF